ncbi:MAG TPA: hypothetical protein VK324_17435, partial [Tepidisphaeraceae bacterium]|nr:hypothetical protein [Tepidisphaeraceae bacterium]
ALAAALDEQRRAVLARAGGGRLLLAPVRWLLTVGALLWFPIVQPVLALGHDRSLTDAAWLLVRVLSAQALLESAAFLAIWFVVLWLALRWGTQRRVARLLARRGGGDADLAAVTVRWADDLLAPVKAGHARAAGVAERASQARRAVVGAGDR